MADQNLRFRTTNDTSQFVSSTKKATSEAKKLQAAQAASQKATRRQGQAFTQFAYALDDIQYGFRGVQNNLQAIAVSAGASGGVVLAITAMTVALNYVIENWEEFGGKAVNAIDEINKAAAADEGLALITGYAQVLKEAEVNSDAYRIALERLNKAGLDEVDNLDEFIRLQNQKILLKAAEAKISKDLSDQLEKAITAEQKLRDLEALPKPTEPITITTGGSTQRISVDEQQRQRDEAIASARKTLSDLQGEIKNYSGNIIGIINGLFPDGIIGSLLTGTGGPGVINASTFAETAAYWGVSPEEQFAVYQEMMTNNEVLADSFKSLGDTIGNEVARQKNFFGILAGAAIKGLGKYIAAHAAAQLKIIALKKAGATADAIKAATETASTLPGVGAFLLPTLIAGAVATVGAAFSGIRGGGGGASAGASRSISSGAGTGPLQSVQGLNFGGGQLVSQIRGDDIFLAWQQASDRRLGLT